MTGDLMLAAASQLLTITGAVWGLTELIGSQFRPGRKPLLAVGLGVVLAVIAHAVGFLTALPECTWTGCGYAAAGFAGLICTVTSKVMHDSIIQPLLKWRAGVAPPVPTAPADTVTTVTTETTTTPTTVEGD